MAKTEITVILPGLASILQQKINTVILPEGLRALLNKSHFEADSSNLTRILFHHFADMPQSPTDLPYAQLIMNKTPVLCATPCYLHADRDRLLLFANEQQLTEQEANVLIKELQELFAEFNATLIQHPSGELLVQLHVMPKVSFSALADVNGKTVTPFLPTGEDKANWIRLWSEIQMKLYHSDINKQREAAGRMPINSLWFWGMGEFIAKKTKWQSIQGEHDLLTKLTQAVGLPVTTVSASLSKGRSLKLLDELDLEADDWQQQLQQWDHAILKPMLQHCHRARLDCLKLHIPDHGIYQLTPLRSWKFW